ncbi:MAG: toprim domain-containing protein [Mariniphaga sp.]
MNCTDANKISIAGYLKQRGTDVSGPLCVSPLHTDKTPSFKIYTHNNSWCDFGLFDGNGERVGGNLIDLVCRLENCDVSGALKILEGEQTTALPSLVKPAAANLTIKAVRPLKKRELIEYLAGRKIPYDIAYRYVKEIRYTTYEGQKSPWFAIGFENNLGGFALRNGLITDKFPKGFKGAAKPNGITTLPGIPDCLNLFEGFISYLSAVSYYRHPLKNTTIVLNSTTNVKEIVRLLPNFKTINLFLDNDETGERTTKLIQDLRPDAINQAKLIYPNHNDFNEFICK